ncbi:MAG: thiamine phosphate synthase [Parvibaculales bacterium]
MNQAPRHFVPRLWVMSDRARLPDLATIIPHLPTNCGLVLRDYDAPARTAYAQHLHHLARQHNVRLCIGGDGRLAYHLRCGWHQPAWMLRRAAYDRACGVRTASVHNVRELKRAAQNGCDAVFIAPIFATKSHPNTGHPNTGTGATLGVVRATALAQLARRHQLLPIALGGLTHRNWQRLTGNDQNLWHGFAAIGFFAL